MSDTTSGVAVLVWRRRSRLEVLLLHRSQFGVSFEGNWAWTTSGGGRQPGETPADTAARELFEETGLRLQCIPVASRVADEQPDVDVDLFTAEAVGDESVRLSHEHDRFDWVQPEELVRCLPAWVAAMYWEALETLPER